MSDEIQVITYHHKGQESVDLISIETFRKWAADYERVVLELETDNRELRRELQYLKDRIQSGQTQEDSNNPTTSA